MSEASKSLLVLHGGIYTGISEHIFHGLLRATQDYADQVCNIWFGRLKFDTQQHNTFSNILCCLQKASWKNLFTQSPATSPAPYCDLEHLIRDYKITHIIYVGNTKYASALWLIQKTFSNLSVLWLPYSIFNEIPCTDHALGYGSVARLTAHLAQSEDFDNNNFYQGIKINVVPSFQNTGWICSAGALAWHYSACEEKYRYPYGPQLIYMPEGFCSLENILQDIQTTFDNYNRCTLLIAETLVKQLVDKSLPQALLGNPQSPYHLTLEQKLQHLVNIIKNNLNLRTIHKINIHARLWSHILKPILSITDQTEAHWLAHHAIRYSMQDYSGLIAIERPETQPYHTLSTCIPWNENLLIPATMPQEFISEERNFVTHKFLQYVAPIAHVKLELDIPLALHTSQTSNLSAYS